MFLTLELSLIDPEFNFQDEIKLYFDLFMTINRTTPVANRFLNKLFNRKVKLISESKDVIFPITLSEYIFKEYIEMIRIPHIEFDL